MTAQTSHEDRQNHPWIGLMSYEEDDAAVFCGRSREAEELARTIIDAPYTTIYGPSGVGKTSLLRAGTFSLIQDRNFMPVYIRLDHGKEAPEYTTQTLRRLTEELSARNVDIEPLAERVAPHLPETLWEFLHRHEFWSTQNHLLKPVLVFDQFEEVFTLADTARAVLLITELGDLCANAPPRSLDESLTASSRRLGYSVETQNYRVVICLREDFLARLEEFTEQIPSLRHNRFSLQAMKREQALEVVLTPGRELVDEPVARRIVDEVTAAHGNRAYAVMTPANALRVEPALLSLFCRELNNRRLVRDEERITVELVEASHTDILRDFYRNALESVSERTASFIGERLLTASGFRSAAAVDDVTAAGISETELGELANRRVLRFENRQGLRWVELSHDILTSVARESRDLRRNEETLRKERERTEALQIEAARQQRRLRLALGGVMVLLLLVVGLVSAFYYLFSMEHVTYYKDIAKRYGFMEGVGEPLSADRVRRRKFSYKFIQYGKLTPAFHRKPVETVVAVNGSGQPTIDHDMETYLWSPGEETIEEQGQEKIVTSTEMQSKLKGVCRWEFVRGEDSCIVYEKGYDKNGNMVWGLVYSPSPSPHDNVCVHFVGSNGFPQKQRLIGAEYVKITYNKHGLEERLEFRDARGEPAPGRWGAFATRYEYNGQGLRTAEYSLDAQGRLMLDRAGNAVARFIYDSDNNVTESRFLDTVGRPCLTKLGIALARFTYDENGNISEQRYYGPDGQPCLHIDGNHGYRANFDEFGNEVERTWYGIDNRPVAFQKAYATIRMRYDQWGNVSQMSLYDVDGLPYQREGGDHGYTAEYDERGNEIAITWFGLDRKPLLLKEGFVTIRKKYDDRGNIIDQRYFDADGLPCLHTDGNHGFITAYDERFNEVMRQWIGIDGKPIALADGYATVRKKYNAGGKLVEWACFDAGDKPTIDKSDGTHQTIWKFDQDGNIIERRNYGINGQPCLNTNRNHGFTAQHDRRGNEVSRTWIGIDGKPIAQTNGYAIIRKRFNSERHMVEWACFDVNDKPTTDQSNGTHKTLIKYDPYGNVTETRYYDTDGRPCLHKDGNHGYSAEFDQRGNELLRTWFGIDDKPIALADGYATVRVHYNPQGKPTEVRYFGADGLPCLVSAGYAMVRKTYNSGNDLIEWACFDMEGKPTVDKTDGTHKTRYKYDLDGNEIERRSYDTEGNLLLVE
jgi:YD repeat-containing protein